MMTAKEYFGDELVQTLNDVFEYAEKSDTEERKNLVDYLRKKADEKKKGAVRNNLLKMAIAIEKIEVEVK
ncbi:hypothetical protein [Enterococcus sp. AZ196]|uniref:hypothetical protein n=1 Tax=Enterococcus sp. AZ196 TaxID=2774659 RepID=UPI003D278FE6